MVTQDDQPRPDLDAAIDAVLPTLSAVSDDAAAASLRRTRIALAEAPSGAGGRGLGPWRWAVPMAAVAAAVVTLVLWPDAHPVEGPRVAVVATPSVPKPMLPATAPVSATSVSAAPPVRPNRPVRTAPAAAAPVAAVTAAPRRDPLEDLIVAVQQIPEDAWAESRARAERAVTVAQVPVAPITVNALDTPSISTLPADPIAPGEP